MSMTLEEIGTRLGVTRERARQIEEVALQKCRIGFGLLDLLGPHAYPVLDGLRGMPLSRFHEALCEAECQAQDGDVGVYRAVA